MSETTTTPDELNPSIALVGHGGLTLGTVTDEGDWGQSRGRFAAWSSRYAERRDGILGFYDSEDEGIEAIRKAWKLS